MPEKHTEGAPVRGHYNTWIRTWGDAIAFVVCEVMTPAHKSLSGQGVHFLPIPKTLEHAAIYYEKLVLNERVNTAESGNPNALKVWHDIVLAAAKAVSKKSIGKERARTIVLDERFEQWRKEFDPRGMFTNSTGKEFAGVIQEYCNQTGIEVETRPRKPVHQASIDAYAQGYADAYAHALAHPDRAEFIMEDLEGCAEAAAKTWAAEQEGR